MKKWTIRILVLLFLLTGSACSQSVPPAEGEETLLVQGESGGPENLPPAFTLWFPLPRRWTPSGLQMRPLWEIPCR